MPALTQREIQDILAQPNGRFALLEEVRAGTITGEAAVTAIEQHERQPLWKRVALALWGTLLGHDPDRPLDL